MTPVPPTMPPRAAAVPASQRASAAGSLVDLMLARCEDAFDLPAILAEEGRGTRLLAARRMSVAPHAASVSSWGELLAASAALAARFESAGLRPGDRLAHQGRHSGDWIVVDLACLLSGVVHVALHADEPRAALREQLRWLRPRGIVFTGGHPAAPRRELPAATSVIDARIDGPPPVAGRESLLAELERRATACDPEAAATIFLSSGTTGTAHGVVHCQRALAANATAAAAVFLEAPGDVRLSWLPLSHAAARVGDLYTALVRGSCLHVVADRRRLLEACRSVPPTVILGVPAFFERLERAVATGAIADLRAALGGRVRVCVSGGAPLRERTSAIFAAHGVPLVQGYGLAEAGPVVTLANPRTTRPGTSGPPLEGVGVRIDTRQETCGQLLVRTPSRAIAVLRPDGRGRGPEVAKEGSRGEEGWIETGDLAEIEPDGQVRITGRIVDTVVLCSGVKLPAAEVERTIAEDPAVAQVCVLGDGLPWPVAIIVPEPGVLRQAIRRMGLRVTSRLQAVRHPQVLAWLARRLGRRQRGLPRAWRARRAVLIGRPFDSSHGEATPSLKLKRRAIAGNFPWVLDAAAAAEPPPWMIAIPARRSSAGSAAGSSLAGAVWHAATADGGFANAASRAAAPLREAVAAVLEQADRAIDNLRADGLLYGPPPTSGTGRPPPLDDAPATRQGIFTAVAEESLGETGFWGLAVPERFGGTGCSLLELVQSVTRMAANVPTAAGMLSVHSSIGAVASVMAFGSAEQQERHLPGLAQGAPLSIFGATEPGAGCDLSAVRSVLSRHGDSLLLTGTKMFITGATHGRLVKLLAVLDGRPAVALVRLPEADTATFRLRHYDLHPLKHAHNAALEFDRFPLDSADLLVAPLDGRGQPDGMRIVWHGLNRGRIGLAAQAAGTLRILLEKAREYSGQRRTWGEPIGSRQLVQGRLGRIAARTVACDALAAWAATSIDEGQTGEMEAITAKIIAGECVRDSALDALGVHGGRAFLVGHPLGDSLHDHLAVTVYEGESDLLGLALFKSLAKHHPLTAMSGDTSSARRLAGWLAWRTASLASKSREDDTILDAALRDHARRARRGLSGVALRIDRAIRRHGRRLADRQLEIGALSAEVRDLVSVLAVVHHADASGDDSLLLPADCWCRLALARAAGRRLTAIDHARIAELGKNISTG